MMEGNAPDLLAPEMRLVPALNTDEILALKRVMDLKEQSVMQLIYADTDSAPSNPPHLGNRVDAAV